MQSGPKRVGRKVNQGRAGAAPRSLEARSTAGALQARLEAARLTNKEARQLLFSRRLEARRRSAELVERLGQLRRECDHRPPSVLQPRRALTTGGSQDGGQERNVELARLHAEYAVSRAPALRAALLEAYDGFAVSLARRFPSRRETPEDLAQAARIGLLHAIDRFEPERGRPFPTFARATILGELKRHVRDRTWVMRVPRSLQEHYLAVVRGVDDLTAEFGRSPRIAEVAERVGLSEEDVLEAMELGGAQRPLSLDLPAGDGEGRLLEPGQHDTALGGVENRALLGALLTRLPERERRILELRFVDELTQSEIADRIGVSQMYVSRLLARTLARMRVWGRA